MNTMKFVQYGAAVSLLAFAGMVNAGDGLSPAPFQLKTCTNQALTSVSASLSTCTTLTSAYVDGSIAPTASPTFTGTLNAALIAATDNVSVIKSTNAALNLSIINANSGTGAYAASQVQNDGGGGYFGMFVLGTGFTTGDEFVQDGAVLEAGTGLSGGLNIVARVAPIKLMSGGTAATATLTATDLNLASGVTFSLNGTAQKFPKTFTATYDPASLASNGTRCDNVTVTGITTTGGAVEANIGAVDPGAGCVMSSVRASAADTVRICWRNADVALACDTTSSTWTFTQAQ
jgi:hypothetical protein